MKYLSAIIVLLVTLCHAKDEEESFLRKHRDEICMSERREFSVMFSKVCEVCQSWAPVVCMSVVDDAMTTLSRIGSQSVQIAFHYVNLAEYIKPCTLTDEDFEKCVKEQIEECLPLFAKGIPELSVPSIDPVDLNDISIDGNGLKLKFSDAKMHGLSDVKLTDLKIHLGGDDESFNLAVKGNLSLTAQYNADGRILILPIKGNGDALIECQNIEVNINCNLTHVKGKDNKEHLKLLAPSYKYDIGSTTFDLKNLFNGNKQLAETTLKFANENWHQLMDDLAPPVVKQIVKTIVKTINKFFSKVTIPRIIKGYKERL